MAEARKYKLTIYTAVGMPTQEQTEEVTAYSAEDAVFQYELEHKEFSPDPARLSRVTKVEPA